MPGAPNRPLDIVPDAAIVKPTLDERSAKIVRRLTLDRVALKTDTWKGAPPPDLLNPLLKAESCYASGDLANAETALDLLSVRFAEPRWPTMALPFRNLRVKIPAPMPPSWDPENALTPEEREAKRSRRAAEELLGILEGAVTWAAAHAVAADDLATRVVSAKARFASHGADAEFWAGFDSICEALRARIAIPGGAPARAPAPSAAPEEA